MGDKIDPLKIPKDLEYPFVIVAVVVTTTLSTLFSIVFFIFIFIKWCFVDWNCVTNFKKLKEGYQVKQFLRDMLFYKPKRKFVNMNLRMLMLLQFFALLSVWTYFLTVFYYQLRQDSAPLCRIQSVVMHFSEWSYAVLILITAIWLFCSLVFSRSVKRLTPAGLVLLELIFYDLVFLIATIFTILPATTDSYGNSDLWCWIPATKESSRIWQMAAYYVPLWIIIFIVFVFYGMTILFVGANYYKTKKSMLQALTDTKTLKTILSVKRLEEGESKLESLRNEIKAYGKLIFTPLIFLVLWIIPTINRVYSIIDPSVDIFLLDWIHLISTNCHAFCIVMVFFFDPIEYFKYFRRVCCCYYCKKKGNQTIEEKNEPQAYTISNKSNQPYFPPMLTSDTSDLELTPTNDSQLVTVNPQKDSKTDQ